MESLNLYQMKTYRAKVTIYEFLVDTNEEINKKLNFWINRIVINKTTDTLYETDQSDLIINICRSYYQYFRF